MGRPRFRRLDYDLYEALERARVPGSTYQVLLVILDFTVGYQISDAPISLTRFRDKTYLSRQGVVHAVHDAEERRIIWVNRRGTNPKAATVYALNMDFGSWVTGKLPKTSKRRLTRPSKSQLTSDLVNQSLPDWATSGDQTSKQPTIATPTESNYNETLRAMKLTEKEETTSPQESPLATGLSSPPVTAIGNGKDKVLQYLRDNGSCGPSEISRALAIHYVSVQVCLNALKRDGKVTNPERAKWAALEVSAVD